jgi:thioredoxin reductase (NADPH)
MGTLSLLESGKLQNMLEGTPTAGSRANEGAEHAERNLTALMEVIVIGSGVAGFTAALYLTRAALEPVVLAGRPGTTNGEIRSSRALLHPLSLTSADLSAGALMNAMTVENFPGWPKGIGGPDLMSKLEEQAEAFGAMIIPEQVVSLDLKRWPFVLTSHEGAKYRTKAVVIASGAKERWLDAPGEKELRGNFVHTCVWCDAQLHQDEERVLVIGGGDSAMEAALYLVKFVHSVMLVHRSEHFKASELMLDRARKHPQVRGS